MNNCQNHLLRLCVRPACAGSRTVPLGETRWGRGALCRGTISPRNDVEEFIRIFFPSLGSSSSPLSISQKCCYPLPSPLMHRSSLYVSTLHRGIPFPLPRETYRAYFCSRLMKEERKRKGMKQRPPRPKGDDALLKLIFASFVSKVGWNILRGES